MNDKKQEVGKQRAFDSFCKKVLKNEARDYYKKAARKAQREVSLEELTYKELNKLYVLDHYFETEHIFDVSGHEIVVNDTTLAAALRRLPNTKRTIILLSYFLGLPDRMIGEYLNMIRGRVQYQRKRSLEELKNLIEEGDRDD